MSIKIETFLALEASLSKRLRKSLKKLTTELYREIDTRLSAGDFDAATGLVNGLSLGKVIDDNQDYIAYLTNMAMLFGASRVTPNPGTSVVGMGYERTIAEQAVRSFAQTIINGGEKQLRKTGLQLIAQAKSDVLIQVEKADRKRVLRPFSSFMNQSGEAFFNMASSLHTSRLSAYGFTAEADALGYTEYQINEQLDTRTCPICAEMHGKVFKVSDARSLLDIVLRVDNPDDLKSLQPWPKQDKASVEAIRAMSPAELVSNHWHIPPFHPGCRGLLVRVSKAPTLEQIASNTIPENYVATREDFKALGASFNQAAVDLWNQYSAISPLEFAARLQGTTMDELMGRLLQSKKTAISGILGMSGGKNIGLRMERAGFGTKLPFYQHIQIKPDYNALYINAVELEAADQGSGMMKKYMQSLVSLTRDMGLPAIRMTAGLDVGGYAWAKYGFVPTQSSWDSLVKTLSTKIAQENLLDGIPDITASAVTRVLASGDPMNIFVLSDLVDVTKSGVPLGKALLMGTTWDGSLLLDSAEPMARFLTYIGGTK